MGRGTVMNAIGNETEIKRFPLEGKVLGILHLPCEGGQRAFEAPFVQARKRYVGKMQRGEELFFSFACTYSQYGGIPANNVLL